MNRLTLVVGAAVLTASCAPMHAPVPFHFAETAPVLERGGIAATAVLGGGKMNYGEASGVGVRGRMGLGARQEVGLDLTVLGIQNDDPVTPVHPWKGKTNSVAGKIAWKVAPLPWVAVLIGAGGANAKTGNSAGGDAGVLLSSPRALAGHWWPSLGVRYTIAVPVGGQPDEEGGTMQGTILAVGLGYDLSPRVRLLLEGGSLKSWHEGYVSTTADPNRTIQSYDRKGSYGALAVTVLWPGAGGDGR